MQGIYWNKSNAFHQRAAGFIRLFTHKNEETASSWSNISVKKPEVKTEEEEHPYYKAGSTSLPCGSYSTSPPLVLKLRLEEQRNDSWAVVGLTPMILGLDTNEPCIQLTSIGYDDISSNYSCSVDNVATTAFKSTDYLFHKEQINTTRFERIICNASESWTLLQWSRGDDVIAMVHRAQVWINVAVERDGPSFSITSIIQEDAENPSYLINPVEKRLNATCRWWTPDTKVTGWQRLLEGRYWIIVVVASSSVLLCLMLLGCFVSIKRKRKVRRQVKSRFFKVSTAARNLYTDSNNSETDIAKKNQDFTYQNVSLSKVVSDDCCSNRSSFLSVGGDSYLEPMAEGGDQVSDGGCYENTTLDGGDHKGSLDGDGYENAGEEMEGGSEGSQSYEDMEGSAGRQTETKTLPDEEITQDEDADSYENMQTPLCTQLHRFLNPPHKPPEEQAAGRKASLVDPITHPHPGKGSTELQEQNGDYYISYETMKL